MKKQGAVSIVLNADRKICLVLRRDLPVWVLPGGGVEKEEKPDQAALREVKEETGLEVAIQNKVGTYTKVNALTGLTHVFLCDVLSGTPSTGDETQECRFFSIDELPLFMPPAHKVWIEHALLPSKPTIKKPVPATSYSLLFKTLLQHPWLIIRYLGQKIFFGKH